MTASILPFRLRQDRVTLRHIRDNFGTTTFWIVRTRADSPHEQLILWQGDCYGAALTAFTDLVGPNDPADLIEDYGEVRK